MFPEHWERGTGTWNVEHHFVKSWYEGGIPISCVPIRDGTCSKSDGNDVPGTLIRNEEHFQKNHDRPQVMINEKMCSSTYIH
jgi:hypothetical protein